MLHMCTWHSMSPFRDKTSIELYFFERKKSNWKHDTAKSSKYSTFLTKQTLHFPRYVCYAIAILLFFIFEDFIILRINFRSSEVKIYLSFSTEALRYILTIWIYSGAMYTLHRSGHWPFKSEILSWFYAKCIKTYNNFLNYTKQNTNQLHIMIYRFMIGCVDISNTKTRSTHSKRNLYTHFFFFSIIMHRQVMHFLLRPRVK